MASGYTSFTGLDGVTLYQSEYIRNPDWSSDNDFCPLNRAKGYNIIDKYKTQIDAAYANHTDFNTGIVQVAGLSAGGVVQGYLCIQIIVYGSTTNKISVTVGHGSSAAFAHSRTQEYTQGDYEYWDDFCKCIYILKKKTRETMTYAALPDYTGKDMIYIVFGAIGQYIGTWNEPSYVYPNGRMTYALSTVRGDASTVLLSVPCASDNTESRKEQSEGVGKFFLYESVYFDLDDTTACAFDGSYNDDADDPYDEDPNEEDPGGNSGEGGGDGDHQPTYEPVPGPDLPVIGPNSAGFVYMVKMTVAQMNSFAADMLSPSLWTAIKNFFADPMDFICGIMLVPFDPTSTRSVKPKFGENVFSTAYPQVTQQYVKVDCGRLDVTKYFGSCFDNNPYTKLLLWLPYIGYRSLDPDECIGKTLHIYYHCDAMTGDCVAFIETEAGSPPLGRVIAQYSGNCGVRVPFGSNSYDAAVAASVQLLGGAVGAIAGGAMAGPVGIVPGEIAASMIANSVSGSTVSSVTGAKTTSERSGVAGASAGYLSIQKPYLFRTIPRQSLPTNYKQLEGYPANIAGPLSNFSGFAAVEMIDLNGLQATKEEIDEIITLLREGVYL